MLLNLLLDFKKQGMTSIIISHKLNEIAYVADRITVLRDGATIDTIDNRGKEPVSEELIIRYMVGRELSDRFPKRALRPGRVFRVIHHSYASLRGDKTVNQLHQLIFSDTRILKHVGGGPLHSNEKSGQKMLCAYIILPAVARSPARGFNRLPCFGSKILFHLKSSHISSISA